MHASPLARFTPRTPHASRLARLTPRTPPQAGPHAPLTRWLFSISAAGIAPAYVLLNAACAAVLVWAPYTLLVEFSMLLSVPSILLFMWSFVALRVQRPETERPFLIPGGLPVAVLITVVPVAISISYAAIVLTESFIGPSASQQHSPRTDSGVSSAFQIWSMCAVIAAGVVVQFVYGGLRARSSRRDQLHGIELKLGVAGSVRVPAAPRTATIASVTERGRGGTRGRRSAGGPTRALG